MNSEVYKRAWDRLKIGLTAQGEWHTVDIHLLMLECYEQAAEEVFPGITVPTIVIEPTPPRVPSTGDPSAIPVINIINADGAPHRGKPCTCARKEDISAT